MTVIRESYDASSIRTDLRIMKPFSTPRSCGSVKLLGHEISRGVELQGSVDLGILAGGVYCYNGVATQKDFRCDYKCRYDWGTFRLERPEPQ